ncbi:MAG: cupin domain-containing protein [Candidatus Competibacteraceae bacterium]|nr:cupin domain-containing protein [Candidatus Competibacteraceae bacterium]
MDPRLVNVVELPWLETKYPGIRMKILLEDKTTGLMTALFDWAPGARLPLHEHVDIEQSFVLEGSFEDEAGVVSAGDFVWRPAGSRHEAWSQDGALLLAFFLSPNRFFDADSG